MGLQTRKRLVILGPTASGKSELAVQKALEFDSAVISVDARQCYKHLNIGTAKPDTEMQAKVPHHYISELEPDERETAADFRRRCDAWEATYPPDKTLVYAGGSTLYLQALLFDLDDIPPASEENLNQLKREEAEHGLKYLYQKLLDADAAYAQKMDGMNRHRIFRALDVWMQTGRAFSSFHSDNTFENPRPGFKVIGLSWPRAVLHERINTRVDAMIKAGLVDEVRGFLQRYDEGLQSLQTVGYREVIRHLKGDISHEQMIADIKTNTRRYAKRQMTWFRRWPFVEWVEGEE